MDETAAGTLHGWVWRNNIGPFFKSVSELVDYSFDQFDLVRQRHFFGGVA